MQQANWNRDSYKEMLIRLAEVMESMQPNLASLARIKQNEIDTESHTDLRQSMSELANSRTRCKDANKVILDMTFRFCKLFVLTGCYGRVVHT